MAQANEAQVERLKITVEEGDMIRSFCAHPGFKLYKEALETKIADKKNTWLKGSDDDAKMARYRAQGIAEALDELKKFMLSGDRARTVLTEIAQDSVLTGTQAAELKV